MYEENKKRFTARDIILQVLFVVLFILILIWLFPTKETLNNSNNTNSILLGRIFNENIQTMKEAGISYYTESRLPKKIGDTKSITLDEMLDKNLVLPFVDANGKTCDTEDSYIEITKYDDEYVMKVNLNCSDNNAYILVHLGCYDYCKGTICESKDDHKIVINDKPTCTITTNNKTFTKSTTLKISSKSANLASKPYSWLSKTSGFDTVTTKTVTKGGTYTGYVINKDGKVGTCSITVKKVSDVSYIYQYKKYKYSLIIGGTSTWGNWSDWSKTAVSETNTRDVETKVVTEEGTKTVYIGTKTTSYADVNQPVYGSVKMVIGTLNYTYCEQYDNAVTTTTGEWVLSKEDVILADPADTNSTRYIYKGTTDISCGNCSNGFYNIYDVLVYNTHVTQTGNQCVRYKTVQTPLYGTVNNVLIGYKIVTKTEPIYGTIQANVDVTYYRYRTLTATNGTMVYKWSPISNDQTLLNKGYKYTGISSTKWSSSSNDQTLINDGYRYTGVKKVK